MFFVFIDTAHKNWASRSGGKGRLVWGGGKREGRGLRYLRSQKIPFLWTEAAVEWGTERATRPPQTKKALHLCKAFLCGATRTLFSLFYLIAKIKRNKE